MKKTVLAVLALILVLSLCTVAFAAPTGRGQKARFVDANNDGICDNCGIAKEECENFIDEDGDGVCDKPNKGNRPGKNEATEGTEEGAETEETVKPNRPNKPNKDEAEGETEEGTETEETVKPNRPNKPNKDEATDDETAEDTEADTETDTDTEAEDTVKPQKGKHHGKRGGKCPKQTNKPRCNKK